MRIGYFSGSHKKALALIAALIMTLSVGTGLTASAQEGPETVRVGYYENEVFQEGASEGSVKTGYAYEYYRKISEYTGWKYEYVYGSYTELYQMLLNGEIDLLAGLAYRPEREGLVLYPERAMGTESYYLVKQDTATDITAVPSTLSGSKIGVLDSAMVNVLEKYLQDNGVTAEVMKYPDYNVMFDDFDSGALDVFVAESDGSYLREHAEVLCAFGSSDYYLCVSTERPDLLVELNEAQAQLAAEEPNYIEGLKSKYYSVSVSARAFSEAEREWIASHTSLSVGYLENYLPYSGTDEKGAVTGIVKDIVPEILAALDIPSVSITFHGYTSYDDMVSDMALGVIDVAFPVGGGLYYSEENGIYLSNPVASASTEIVFAGTYTEDTLTHFAVNENNRMQYYYIRTHYPDAEITFYPSIDDCLEAVLSGDVGCTTLNGLRANDILKNRRYRGLSLHQTNRSDDRCFGVEIGNEGLLKLLNRGINVIGADYAQNLSYRYVGGLYTYSFLDALRDHMAVFGSVILAVAAVIIFLLMRDSKRTHREAAEKEEARIVLEGKNRELAENREALSVALDAANNASRAKTVFLNNMSHDIRTPMNAIVGFTTLAQKHIDNTEQVRDYLGRISVSSQHLLSLINDVLDMSRIESGNVTIEERDVHLPDVIHDLVTIIRSSVEEKQLELSINATDVIHEDIVTDRLRLNQILLNILSNSVKFTPEGGRIKFSVTEKPQTSDDTATFEFVIKDNGIGMSEEFQRTIFEAFTREKTSTVSGIQGTGLGMSITKNIVDMMGGTISVRSEEKKGSEFTVVLPFRISEGHDAASAVPALRGLRALVVDSDEDACRSVCDMLKQMGMRSDWAARGKEAVIMAKEALDSGEAYSVCVIDLLLPDLSGIETAGRIRSATSGSVSVMILTVYDSTDIEEEAREAGVTDFCSKPIFLSELNAVLSRTYGSDEQGAHAGEESFDFTGRRLLLAEDNEMNRMIATAILTEAGFELDIAVNGQEAVEKVASSPAGYYDAVLMDVQMPVMDGYEATRAIRSLDDPEVSSVPVIAVTANAFEEDRRLALESGMNAHLAKPYDIPEMMRTISEVISGHECRQEE